jgi:phosphodiesterase/alkaline phosphatase D-like protein
MLVCLTAPGFAGMERAAFPKGKISRIAFGSCAFQWDEQKIWNTVVAKRPDLFLLIGDAIYGDFDGKKVVEVSRATLEADWKKVASKPTFQRLWKTVLNNLNIFRLLQISIDNN